MLLGGVISTPLRGDPTLWEGVPREQWWAPPAQEVPLPVVDAVITAGGGVERLEVVETVLAGSSASSQGESRRRKVLEFDRYQRLVAVHQYDPRGALEMRILAHYRHHDDHSNEGSRADGTTAPAREIRGEDRNGALLWRWEGHYSPSGMRQRDLTYGPTGLIEEVTVYQHDGARRVVQETRYRRGVEVMWHRRYRHGVTAGEPRPGVGETVVSWDLVGAEGERIRQVRQYRDYQGRLVLEQSIDQMGAVWEEIRLRYGERTVELERRGPEGRILEEQHTTFDTRGNPLRLAVHTWPPGGTYPGGTSPAGVSPAVRTVTHTYRYDSYGNWTERDTTYTGPDGTVTRRIRTVRTFTYYHGGDAPAAAPQGSPAGAPATAPQGAP